MKSKIIVTAVMVAAAMGLQAASKGSCLKKAISLKSSQVATLVNEYDPEEKEYYDDGALYYSVALRKNTSYTIWITGGQAANMSLDVDTNWDYYENREDEPMASFDVFDIDGGATQVAYLYADDWDDDDPSSGKFVVSLYGDIGASTTLGFTTGIRSFTMTGQEDSPKVITMGTSVKNFSSKLIDGEYWFRTSLKAGRKYRVRTKGGTATSPLAISVNGVGADVSAYYTTDAARFLANNDALVVVPDASGKFNFTVEGDSSQKFTFQYQMVPARGISAHSTIPLLEENEYKASFVPGRIADTHNYYDQIIDEHLCRIYLNKGERWSFETEGATVAQRMVAYDSKGTVLGTNETMGNGSLDTRVVITASAAGVYYVGVCNPALDVEDKATGSAITLTATPRNGALGADGYDPSDDVLAGANMMVPYPATTNDWAVATTVTNEEAIAIGAVHGTHRFDSADLYDVFAFACRKGFTYKVRASFASEEETSNLSLAAKVFNLNNGKERNVTYTGTITPSTADADLTFKATANAVHYVRVWVEDGRGLDFPGYNMHVIAVNGANPMGFVKVVSKGAEGTWSLDSDKASLTSGATLSVAPGTYTVRANAVSGFTTPPATPGVVVPVWADGDPVVVVTNVYSDIYDAKYQIGTKTVTKNGKKTTTKVYSPADGDATAAGAFAIVPKVAVATLNRTLWNNDPADMFTFTAAANTYYNFTLSDTTLDAVGDAVMTITGSDGAVYATNVTEVARLRLPAGAAYVAVTHGTGEKVGSSYSMSFSKATAGIVRFTDANGKAATEFVANETAASAVLYVARTGSEGAVRVRYETHAGTAVPGTNYYPVVTNEISWASSDKAVKAIKIRLMPESYAAWAPSNLFFTVRLLPVDEYGFSDGEYLAIIPSATAKVTIKNTTAKGPGSVSLVSYGADTAVSNVKKPAVVGTAGEDLVLTFARTGGTDGPVSVKVASPTAAVAKKNKDTALAGRDYVAFSETLSWADGEDGEKTVSVDLLDSSNYAATKKFVFTIAAVNTDGTLPNLPAKSATMTILNDTVAQTAAAYAKTIASSTGLKLSATGTWFNDYDGELRSGSANGTLTYTLIGPGLFACEPTVNAPDPSDKATLKCRFYNKGAKLDETVNCSAEDFGGNITKVIPAGTTTVTFTLSGVSGGAYASFASNGDGVPYSWIRFASTTPEPMTKSVVETNGIDSLRWTLPDALVNVDGLYCRTRFGTAANSMAVVTNVPAASCAAELPYAVVAGKTYYWTVDYAYTAETNLDYEAVSALKWTAGPTTWQFSVLAEGAPVSAIALDEEDSSPLDMAGQAVIDIVAAGEPVQLIQGVNVKSLGIGLEGVGKGDNAMVANKYRVVGGTLPKGVSIDANTGLLTGAPAVVGTYTALLQSYNQTGKTTTKKVNGKTKKVTTYTYAYGTTIPVTFEVVPGGTMFGTYRGALVEDGSELDNNTRHAGLLVVTATSAGKITAKATIAGVAYTFSGTAGYDELLDREDSLPGVTAHVRVALGATVKTMKNKKVTGTYKDNSLVLVIPEGVLTNTYALAEAVGTAEMELSVLNAAKTAVTAGVRYKADLFRANGSIAEHKAAMSSFAGYYTVALVPEGISAADGFPVGNGYLTLTVSEAASVKVTGVLADGMSVSFSTVGEVLGEDIDETGECTLNIPVYAGNANYALAGVLRIGYESSQDGALPVVLPTSSLTWVKNAAATTSLSAEGFDISLVPTGGWYDKVVNLQAYYMDRGFAISAAEGEDMPAAALANGYSFSTLSTPNDLEVVLAGNGMTVAARSLVKNKTTGLYDFGSSVNPWNTTVKLNRATGIVTGSFNAWGWVVKNNNLLAEYNSAQKSISSLAHRGVLLFSRASSGSPLAENATTAGFFLMPATTSTKAKDKNKVWKASLPFNILYEENESDWLENEE